MGVIGTEIWGPKNATTTGHHLVKTAHFNGRELPQIDKKTRLYLQTNPRITHPDLISHLSGDGDDTRRIENALTILNQLAAVDRTAYDINGITVLEDLDSVIANGRTGEGKHHQWYQVDWVRRPEDTEAILARRIAERNAQAAGRRQEPRPPRPGRVLKPLLPWREREELKRQQERAAERARREQLEEPEEIESVIMDLAKENVDIGLRYAHIKIELQDGKAVIISRSTGQDDYRVIDLADPWSLFHCFTCAKGTRKYLGALTKQAEGEKLEYSPDPLTPTEYQDIYERAVKIGMIKIKQSPEGEITFLYQAQLHLDDFVFPSWGEVKYAEMNLIDDIVDTTLPEMFGFKSIPHIRPVNPHFADFLKQKKAELEQTLQ